MTESSDLLHPGKILYDQAMQPLGVSRNKLARDIDVPVGRISDIVAGKRGITPDTALRLGKYFGTSAEMWMQFQTDYDLFVSRASAWPDIAPRVRELQPLDPETMAVAPVTAMDRHAQAWHDADPASQSPDRPAAAAADADAPSHDDAPDEAPGEALVAPLVAPLVDGAGAALVEAAAESEEKWWLMPFSDEAADAPDEQPATAASPDMADAPEDVPDEAGLSASEDDAPVSEQTFEIDIRPAAASSHVVAGAEPAAASSPVGGGEPAAASSPVGGGEPAAETAGPARPQRRFSVEVVREEKRTLEPSADEPGAPEVLDPPVAASAEIDKDEFTIEMNADELAGELPEDAFASELDDGVFADGAFADDAFAGEAADEPPRENYAPVMARTGTDDFETLDPPTSGAPTTGIADLTPANWTSALESARRDEPGIAAPATPGPASRDDFVAPTPPRPPAISDHFDVPLPSEFEPALEGHLAPWPPAEADDPSTALDIPDPEDARKLYEYDD